ncbi:hypothetical protein GF412_02060 [Candidatus Micrarchaeota archaeon]|nr:hypothetical protein [Candidatus Micrarchaeota archaeon]MBD3417746.1 hypothetical protein [Candidatus Micrarchaeota archaeon]
MSTKVAVAVAFIVLFSLGLAFQGAPPSTILICAISIAIGSALPDLDRLFFPVWKYLKYLLILMGALLFGYVFTMAPALCYYIAVPYCTILLPALVGIFILFIFLFDFLDPSKPPFHSLIAMVFAALTYSLILSYAGFVESSFLATGAFAAAYTLHYFLESANVDRSRL